MIPTKRPKRQCRNGPIVEIPSHNSPERRYRMDVPYAAFCGSADRDTGFGYCTHMIPEVRWSDGCKIDRLRSYKCGKSYQPAGQRRYKCWFSDWRVIFKPKAIHDQCIGLTIQLWIKACNVA